MAGMDPQLKAKLQKQRYHIVGEHGGVKTCHWTKESLLRSVTASATRVNSTALQATTACKCHPLLTSATSLALTVGENHTWTRSS